MKKKIFSIFALLMICSMAFSKPKNLEVIVIKSPKPVTNIYSNLKFDYEFIDMFYRSVCFNLSLFSFTDQDYMKNVCKILYENIRDGYEVQIIVKKYINNKDLVLDFKRYNIEQDNLAILSNFDINKKKILSKGENSRDAYALLYYLQDDHLVWYEYFNKNLKTPEKQLEDNLAALEKDPKGITYTEIVLNYFELGRVDEGLKFLNENKDKAIELDAPKLKPIDIKSRKYREWRYF